MEIADEAYAKRCHNCGKRVGKPILHRGYVFCSEECRDAFISKRKP